MQTERYQQPPKCHIDLVDQAQGGKQLSKTELLWKFFTDVSFSEHTLSEDSFQHPGSLVPKGKCSLFRKEPNLQIHLDAYITLVMEN